MKVKVRINCDDIRDSEYKNGEEGYIVGFCQGGGNGCPYVVVAVGKRLIMCENYKLDVINIE